jgi:hypothetical protein
VAVAVHGLPGGRCVIVWSLLSPTPPWVTINQSGLLTIGLTPIAGYSGIARVQAVDGARTAVLDIPIAIQPAYEVVLDYVEIFEAAWSAGFGASFDSIELEAAIEYGWIGENGAVYTDLDLGGVGADEFDVVINGVGVEVDGVQVIMSPVIDVIPATFTSAFGFENGVVTIDSIPATFATVFDFDAQLSTAYTQVAAYTVNHQRGPGQPIFSFGNWANLNDRDRQTGVFVDSGTFSRVIINLGSALTIQEIRLDGGFIAGFDVDVNLNGLDLQYSSSAGGPWTTFAIVSGISNFGPAVIYNPNITAQYWRLADESNPGGAACTSAFEFYI